MPQGDAKEKGCVNIFLTFCLLLCVAVGIPIFLVRQEVEFRDRVLAFNEAGTVGVMECKSSANDVIGGSLHSLQECIVHSGPSHIASDEVFGTVADDAFGVKLDNALKLERFTEYCQWQEFRNEKCDTCGDEDSGTYECNCVTEITYVKGWRSHRVNSLIFDQPAAHHNPQRDP